MLRWRMKNEYRDSCKNEQAENGEAEYGKIMER
jgi:hypothetical protein